MKPLRVLITNNTLESRGGTELYVRDLALALLRRGHKPAAFTTHPGAVADELRAATIPVVGDLGQLGDPPDIIHGQHHVDAMIAMLHFARTPAIYLCHGWQPWEEWPPRFSRIRRYLAVDETCRDRMVSEHGLAERDVELLLNFVDLRRFAARTAPLPTQPRRALVFSNQADETTGVNEIRAACQTRQIELEVVGRKCGFATEHPENLLGQFDLVFARARSALEAMATGAAVVLYGPSGVGPLVTTREFDRLRPLNFGIRALQRPCTPDYLVEQISQYDAGDAMAVTQRVRSEAGLDAVVDRLVQIYREVIHEHSHAPLDADLSQREASAYLQCLQPRPHDARLLRKQLNEALAQARQPPGLVPLKPARRPFRDALRAFRRTVLPARLFGR